MATEHGIVWPAVIAAAPSVAGAIAADTFSVPVAEYLAATAFSLLGIVARHCYEASQNDRFNLKALAFDLPTAPMLGIVAYIICIWADIAPMIIPGIVILLSFLGPEWVRSIGSRVIDILVNRTENRP